MFKKEKDGVKEFSKEELQDILTGVRQLSKEELEFVVGGKFGDDREYFTTDKTEIENDIFGSKF